MTRPAAVPGSAAARRTGATDRWINYAAATTVAGLAGVAGALSYSHMRQLAQEHGQVGWHAHAFPLSVDGVEIVASLVLLANRRAGHRSGWLPWAALAAGTAGSLAANIATAHPDLVSRVIVGWPALALLLAIKLLAGILEHRDAPGSRAAIVPAPALPASIPDQADPASAALARKVPECTGGPATSQAGPGTNGTAGTARPPDITELPPAAAALLPAARLARDALAARLRRHGHPIRNASITPLLRSLRHEKPPAATSGRATGVSETSTAHPQASK